MADKPRFEITADVEKCREYLKTCNQATYAELAKHTGRDIKGRDRYVLEAARRRLERENIVFVVVTGVGVKRADHSQVASLSTTEPIGKIKRAVRRANKRQQMVDVQNLSEDERLTFYVGRAVLGAISQAARDAFRNRVMRATNTEVGPLDVKATLALFGKLRNGNGAEH